MQRLSSSPIHLVNLVSPSPDEATEWSLKYRQSFDTVDSRITTYKLFFQSRHRDQTHIHSQNECRRPVKSENLPQIRKSRLLTILDTTQVAKIHYKRNLIHTWQDKDGEEILVSNRTRWHQTSAIFRQIIGYTFSPNIHWMITVAETSLHGTQITLHQKVKSYTLRKLRQFSNIYEHSSKTATCCSKERSAAIASHVRQRLTDLQSIKCDYINLDVTMPKYPFILTAIVIYANKNQATSQPIQ